MTPLPAPTKIKYNGRKDSVRGYKEEFDANTNPWKKVPVVNEAAETMPSHRNQIDKRMQKMEVITMKIVEDVTEIEEPVSEYQSKPDFNVLHGKEATGSRRPNDKIGRKPRETKKKEQAKSVCSGEPTKTVFESGKV